MGSLGARSFLKTDLTRDVDIELREQARKYGAIRFLANIAGIQHINAIEISHGKIRPHDEDHAAAPLFSKLCIPT